MNIYEYALQMEHDGGKYYLLLAENCQVEGIVTIFTILANEEVKHYNAIVDLQKNDRNSPLVKTTVLENVKNIFIRMKEEKADVRIDSSEIESYRKAMAIEEMSWKFYLDKAANVFFESLRENGCCSALHQHLAG